MQYYFNKHAWGNTTISDFLEALEFCAKDFNAAEWSKEWLETSGLNTLQISLSSDESNKLTKCSIIQTATPENPTLRKNHLEIVVFDYDKASDALTLRDTFHFEVLAQKETTLKCLIGQPKPSFIFINHDDYAFAKCFLDPESQDFAIQHMNKFTSPLLRQILWNSFYDFTRDAQMSAYKYLQLVLNQIEHESDRKLTQTILDRANACLSHFIPDAGRVSEQEKLFELAHKNFLAYDMPADLKIIWERVMVNFAGTKKNVEILVHMLTSGSQTLSSRSRWSIIVMAQSWDLPVASQLLTTEKEKDKSDTAVRSAISCAAAIPTAENKLATWNKILDKESKMSLHEQEAAMHGFFWFHQRELTKPYTDKYFSIVRDIFKTHSKEFGSTWVDAMYPSDPENDALFERTKVTI